MLTISGEVSSGTNPLLIIAGRTASGKDTLAKQLLSNGRTLVTTYTTRPRRPGEGNTHHFIDNPEDYQNRVLETEVNGYHYFALDEDLYKHDILIVDANGLRDLQNHTGFNRPYRIIYLDIDEDTRRSRYIARANTDVDDFIRRNDSEAEQFDRFEQLIESDEYRDRHNITVIHNDTSLTHLIETL